MRCTELHPRTNNHVMEVPIMTFYGYMKRNYYNKEGRKIYETQLLQQRRPQS